MVHRRGYTDKDVGLFIWHRLIGDGDASKGSRFLLK